MSALILLALLAHADEGTAAPSESGGAAVSEAPPGTALPQGRWAWDRVDLLSEDPGYWFNYELPAATAYPTRALIRLVEQVKVVFDTPVTGLSVGASLQSQSIWYEQPLLRMPSVTVGGGLFSSLLLPRGVVVDAAWRRGPLRLAVGISADSQASWAHLDYSYWMVMPTFGVGIGRSE